MIREKKEAEGPPVIDLTGPDGNAFVLIGYARRFARQINLDADAISKEMMSAGSYEKLLEVFESYFGDFVILER